MNPTSTPRPAIFARASATSTPSGASSIETKLVSTTSTSTWRPAAARPSASRRARAWSSASRSTLWSSAYRAAAATIPAWRIAPPNRDFPSQASSIRFREEARMAPRGQPRPFEKHSVTLSASRPYSAAGTPPATAAFRRRAPSRWTASPSSRAACAEAASSSSGQTRPPALRWVFSNTTTLAGSTPSHVATAARSCSGVRRPATPGSPYMTRPEWTAGPPASKIMQCVRSSANRKQPGLVRMRRAIWFAIVAVGRKSAASWPSSSAARRWSSFTVGSSRSCSSPTSAAAMAARISAIGCVAVSERRSITSPFLPAPTGRRRADRQQSGPFISARRWIMVRHLRAGGRMNRIFLAAAFVVLIGAALPASASALTRKQANAIAMRTLHPKAGKKHVILFSLPKPLKAGSRIVPVNPVKGKLGKKVRRPGTLLRRAAWLFWLDQVPYAKFSHPSRYLLVDNVTGRVVKQTRTRWYPAVNGRPPAFLASRRAYGAKRYRVFARVARRTASSVMVPFHSSLLSFPFAWPRANVPAGALKGECVLIISAFGDSQFQNDYDAFSDWSRSHKIPTYFLTGDGLDKVIPDGTSKPADNESLLDGVTRLRAKEGCTDIVIYMSGHGLDEDEGPPSVVTRVQVDQSTFVPTVTVKAITASAVAVAVSLNPTADF